MRPVRLVSNFQLFFSFFLSSTARCRETEVRSWLFRCTVLKGGNLKVDALALLKLQFPQPSLQALWTLALNAYKVSNQENAESSRVRLRL